MKILISTFGASWQILPELVGLANPSQFDFFRGNAAVEKWRKDNAVEPVDEFWLITTKEVKDEGKINAWQKRKLCQQNLQCFPQKTAGRMLSF